VDAGVLVPVGDVDVALRRECRVRAAVERVSTEPGRPVVDLNGSPHAAGDRKVLRCEESSGYIPRASDARSVLLFDGL
jgi:hypothetical protein